MTVTCLTCLYKFCWDMTSASQVQKATAWSMPWELEVTQDGELRGWVVTLLL
jgi:hypothetical protein